MPGILPQSAVECISKSSRTLNTGGEYAHNDAFKQLNSYVPGSHHELSPQSSACETASRGDAFGQEYSFIEVTRNLRVMRSARIVSDQDNCLLGIAVQLFHDG